MLEIIKEKEIKEKIYYTYDFERGDGSGFTFPCNENGIVKEEDLNPYALENYQFCLNNKEDFEWFGIQKHEINYTEPAIGKCHCGEEFELISQYMGACECPNCGQWYNIFGQELLPPDRWNEY